MSEDDLVRRLQVGHDSGCAMSYGMHEHCCDCSYPDRQESAETILKLRQELAAARAALRELIGMIEIAAVMPDAINKHMRVDWDDPVLQRARAALAGQRREGEG